MDDYESFKKQIFALTQIDLNAYKEKGAMSKQYYMEKPNV